MSRIRTVKPEMFESEDIASVSVTAVLTFIGLLTLSDDSGRCRDHPAIIAGRLWALRQDHSPAHVAQDLEELAEAGLICRYTGCDGRTYLHIVKWEQHQKINRATDSRLPRCPGHQVARKCGKCQGTRCPSVTRAPSAQSGPGPDRSGVSVNTPGGCEQPDSTDFPPAPEVTEPEQAREPAPSAPPGSPAGEPALPARRSAGQSTEGRDLGATHAHLTEGSRPGSRILDPGSSRRGREAPAPDASSERVSAKELVAEYVNGCHQRPPGNVISQLGRNLKALLDEGFDPKHIRPAMDRLRAKALHPSVLPSLVNEVVNPPAHVGAGAPSASGGGPWATTGHQPYLNPNAPEPTTFGRSL
ncbi:hypothetical protein [Streptomyces uncialis]|uniref:hypothetical protein n=1 Tax=Streptomyces uncialis TaxID=1048205 RepID=UPI00386703EC|nr:hypothetical protein OG924_29900 [Streptomyces uncialis]